MNSWQRWMQAPQTHWLRKLLFQVHLWLGLAGSLYLLLISLSGAAILLKSPVVQMFASGRLDPVEFAAFAETEFEGEALQDKMAEVYSGYEIYFTVPAFEPDRATYVVLNKDGEVFPRYFNQYNGEDIGPSNPWQVRTIEWMVNIHDDLFMGRQGRKLNGIGAGLLLLMAATGSIIWWQGRLRWRQGMQIKRNSHRGFNWQLHSFIGFWFWLLLFAWGLSGVYLGFPRAFNEWLLWGSNNELGFQGRPAWLQFLLDIHFARFGEGAWPQWGWIAVSLLPSVMVVSGVILWWKRVILKNQTQR